MGYSITEGNYKKFGVQRIGKGIIFTFEGEKEDACFILVYDAKGNIKHRIEVPADYCMGSVRSVCVEGLVEKRLYYNYEINGEVIVDTYAERIIGRDKWNHETRKASDYQISGGFEECEFDWENDNQPEISKRDMVMYKLHVRGFSMDDSSAGKQKGTFAAVQKKISYLKELGITTIEFMPVYEFEEIILEEKKKIPDYLRWKPEKEDVIQIDTARKRVGLNYWGYTAGNYFAVKASYSSEKNPSTEWKTLVKELHRNGMECIMEMFFPNSINQNVILDALRFWVREYHVDGFHLLGDRIPITAITQDLFLSRTKIFYQGFDASLYENQGKYPHLYTYNDEYLYPARKMVNLLGGSLEEFANQQRKQNELLGFVNYFATNNGFTLYDVFAYQEKHNETNGEANTDGNNWNFSSNCGIEGKTAKKFVKEKRQRQIYNALTMLFTGQGVPLLLAGDEMGNSQSGNNNAYCQDNKVGWVNWKQAVKYVNLTDFAKKMCEFRKKHPIIAMEKPMKLNDYGHKGFPDLSYHGTNAWLTSFSQTHNVLGIMYCGAYATTKNGEEDDMVYIGYNFSNGESDLALPKLPGKKSWYLVMNTEELEQPFLKKEKKLANQHIISVAAQSTVILIGK